MSNDLSETADRDAEPPTLGGGLVGWFRRTQVRELFGADLRSLAVLRMALAFIVLLDIAGRIPTLAVHYTDEGALPRDVLIDNLSPWRWSLYFIAGTDVFGALMFGVTVLAAIGMLLGYCTRVMTVVVWIMVVSLQTRNPLVLSHADSLLRLLLFWSMFLPLGARWSLDSMRLGSPVYRSVRFVSVASAGLFAQIAFMYFFTAILKSGAEWRSDGTALYYAFGAQHLTRDLGEFLFQYEGLLRVLTFGSLGLEVAIPFLLFFPLFTAPVRTAAVAVTMAFHLGIFATMDLGIFPLASALSMTCFLPTWFWDQALQSRAVRHMPMSRPIRDLTMRTSALFDWSRSAIRKFSGEHHPPPPPVSGGEHQSSSVAVLRANPLANVFTALCLVLVLGWNIASVSTYTTPDPARPLAQTLGLYQKWSMFAPYPPHSSIWYVYKGKLADGTELNLLPTTVQSELKVIQPVSWDMPEDISSELYGSKYWRKYFDGVADSDNSDQRLALAGFICRWWNGHYEDEMTLVEMDMYRVSRPTLLGAKRGPVDQDLIADYTCTQPQVDDRGS